jgi:hypothetical protein
MTGRRLRTAGVFVAVLVLLSGSVAAAPAASLSADGHAAVGPPGGLPDPVPDFVATVLELLVEFVDSIADGNLGNEVSEPAGGWW